MSPTNPLKHAHLFQRTLQENATPVYAYIGLLETKGGQPLEEDALNILSHAQKQLIDTEGSLRDVFTIATVDKHTEWGASVNNAMTGAKKDYGSPHPTVSEYLKMPCWPRFSTEPETSSLLQISGFRLFVTEKPDTYVIFGISTHPLIQDSPEEAWLTLNPQGAELCQAPCKTNGSTLDQVLTMPVWQASDQSTWSLSYNSRFAHQTYDQLNQIASELLTAKAVELPNRRSESLVFLF